MFWIAMAVLLLVAAGSILGRRRAYESDEQEPWRASLDEEEPLDVEEARRAEEEFLAEDFEEDDESWS
jgi:hypothetical protein